MNLYSHYVLARRLERLIKPDDPKEYAWGAIIPDIRYLIGASRKQTHVEIARIKSWSGSFPAHRSFVQGYLVHCLLDQIDVAHAVQTAFPMRFLRKLVRKTISLQEAAMLVELYYQREAHLDGAFSGEHNEILTELGVQADQTRAYAEVMGEYLAQPTFEGAVRLAHRLGLVNDSRVEKYLNAANSIQRNKLALWPLLWSVRNARFEQRGARLLRAALEAG